MKRFSFLFSIGVVLLLCDTSRGQTASNYYLPLSVGNHLDMITVGSVGSGWASRTTTYSIEQSNSISGYQYYLEKGSESLDGSGQTDVFRLFWLRKDSVGNVVMGALSTNGSENVDSALIVSAPMFPNEYLTNGYSRSYPWGPVTYKDSVLSTTETVSVSAGTFQNCLKISETHFDSTGAAIFREVHYFANGVGMVKNERTIPTDQIHTDELTGYLVQAQTQWSVQNSPTPTGTLLGKVQFISASEGWISADNGSLLHTTNAGSSWNIVVPFPNDTVFSISDPAISMWWVNQTHGWKINWFGSGMGDAYGAVMHKTTDRGVSWTKKTLSTGAGDMGLQVQFVDEQHGWASVYNMASKVMTTLRSTDGGNNWNPVNTGGIFYFVDANNGWAIASPKITHTTNGGTDWSTQYTDPTPGDANAIQFTDLNNGWVVGDSGKILKTTNGGNTWTSITNTGIPYGSKSKCVFALNATTAWIGTNIPNPRGDQRAILYTNNGGLSWTTQNPQISESVFSIFSWDANNGWYSGVQCVQNCNGPDSERVEAGVIGHTTNGGATEVKSTRASIPSGFSLSQSFPNPFNPSSTIRYGLPTRSRVHLTIYNILGQVVADLVNGEQAEGWNQAVWNANVASGLYFYRLEAVSVTDQNRRFVDVKKMILLK